MQPSPQAQTVAENYNPNTEQMLFERIRFKLLHRTRLRAVGQISRYCFQV
ncbi:MAG: hypothetical protein JKY34_12330 [Kordiimonadaceae bacterium]|nr:hypothetical protein [Kordiimonadaceae bacterium]